MASRSSQTSPRPRASRCAFEDLLELGPSATVPVSIPRSRGSESPTRLPPRPSSVLTEGSVWWVFLPRGMVDSPPSAWGGGESAAHPQGRLEPRRRDRSGARARLGGVSIRSGRIRYGYGEHEATISSPGIDRGGLAATGFSPVVARYLVRIAEGHRAGRATDFLRRLTPGRDRVDPARSFGQPIFVRGQAEPENHHRSLPRRRRAPRFAEDFGVPLEHVDDVLRVTLPLAA